MASSLDRLGRAPDGTVVQVPGPDRWEVPGWYELGPRPGELGSAVILGTSTPNAARQSSSGCASCVGVTRSRVTRADGSSVRFVVERTAQYDKQRFPTDEVYYPTLTSALRLVTCGRQFDHSTGHYRSNIIVFAMLRT